jgi:DNA gyrase/topoisomerase IV subunit B
MAQLTKEQMAAIDSYSDDIETLKDQVTAMRKMPGYYIAGVGYKGALSLIREGYQNSIDQIMDPTSPADTVSVYYNEQTLECEITDNGKGFPFDGNAHLFISASFSSKCSICN